MPAFPPQVLTCPHPAGCPVPRDLPELTPVTVAAGRALFRVYSGTWGYDEHNPGFGDARFSPFDDPISGMRVPAIYLAEDETSALLETVFHDVHEMTDRTIYEQHLIGQMLVYLRTPTPAVVGDLRDAELTRLRLSRRQLVSTPAEHYPCTRRLAAQAVSRTHHGQHIQGLIWHSRQAELAGRPDAEVMVLYGHRYDPTRGSWALVPPGIQNLFEGRGRVLVEEIADSLGAVVEA